MNKRQSAVPEAMANAGATITILSLLIGALIWFNIIPGGACSAVGGIQLLCMAFLSVVGAGTLVLGLALKRRNRTRDAG